MASSTVSSCVLSWRWPAVTMIETERGGYGYPGTLSWSPVGFSVLPSGLEPHLTPPGPPRACRERLLGPLLLLLCLLLHLLLPPQLRPLLRELDVVDRYVHLCDS